MNALAQGNATATRSIEQLRASSNEVKKVLVKPSLGLDSTGGSIPFQIANKKPMIVRLNSINTNQPHLL